VLVDAGGLVFVGVTVGVSHSCGVTAAGAAYCWGDGSFGQLGHSSNQNSASPVQVVDIADFSSLRAGASYTCGVRAGTDDAWCWGFNASGQLGADAAETCLVEDNGINVTQVDCSSVPVPVTGGLTFSTVAPNSQHTCGVVRSGGVYCWGFGDRGQLGNGMSGQNYLSVEPVRVAGQSETEPLPEPGREVRARLSPAKQINLGNITVNEINRIDGSVYSNGNDSLALWTQWVHSAFGERYYANGSVFYFPRQEVSRLEERRLMPAKTVIAVGGGVVALAIIFGLATQLGGGEGPGQDPGPQLRIGIPLR
jgi:hypothetical protein